MFSSSAFLPRPLEGVAVDPGVDAITFCEEQDVTGTVFDVVRTIRDPEKPNSLEELGVVTQQLVTVRQDTHKGSVAFPHYSVSVGFAPTVPHCSLATLIGLCLRKKLERNLPPEQYKFSLYIKEGSHQSDTEITKQINDKERVAAAMENPQLRETVETCIREEE